jgi:hypothetical protein
MSQPYSPHTPPAPVLAKAGAICRRIGGEAQQEVDELLRALRGELPTLLAEDGAAFRRRWSAGEETLVDAETGAATPVVFRDRVRHSLARFNRCGTRFAVLYVGYTGAEPAAAARSIAAGLRSTDTVAAAGEGALTILLDTLAAPGDAEAVAARLRHELMMQHRGVSVFIGLAYLAPHGTDADTVLWNAYTAMCRARLFGPGRIEVASVCA